MIFGFNDKLAKIGSTEKTELCVELGANAVEFSFSKIEDYDVVKKRMLSADATSFDYVSLHAPRDVRYDRNDATDVLLGQLEELVALSGAACVVLHADIVDDWDLVIESGIPFAIENMDHRKEFGKTIEDMVWIHERTEFPVVIDLNHCYTNDPTMKLAEDFIETFRGKIAEFHLSGYIELHEPLHKTGQKDIISFVDTNIPIIVESKVNSLEEVEDEFEYIMSKLN